MNNKNIDCVIIDPDVFYDKRGYFFESYNKNVIYNRYDISDKFVQDNESYSVKNVIRGLHFQIPPYAQAKLVRVTHGKVLDIVVDVRVNSETFGDYFSVNLSAQNKKQLYIPEGFAHGFVALTEKVRLCYKCDEYYKPKFERGIRWDDPDLNIDWSISKDSAIVSEKDFKLPRLSECTFLNDISWES
ncbi:MAG: dTDP-4-dehydrorhamnose 3,5-epimerase [Bacteroidota bacterium]